MKRYVKLTVLSPVYIGDDKGQRSPLEYYLEQGAYVHVISEDKLIRALKECNKLNDFMSYLERETSPNMNRFFQQLAGQQNFVLRKATERKIKTKVSHLSNLRLHMVDPVTAEPYIPATSIKGSLRLALLYCLASRNVEAFRNKVKDAMEDRRNQREPGRNLDAYYFQRYDIAPNSRSNIGTRNDLLRMLKISDAFVDPHSRVDYVSEVVQVKVISLNDASGYHFSSAGKNEINIYVEAIRPGTQFVFDIDIDDFLKDMFAKRGFNDDLEELLKHALELKYSELIEEEKSFFKKANVNAMVDYYESLKQKGANFRLGWGSGLLNTTAAMLLTAEQRKKIRERYFKQRKNPVFPQSRKVVVDQNNRIIHTMGWCKLELV